MQVFLFFVQQVNTRSNPHKKSTMPVKKSHSFIGSRKAHKVVAPKTIKMIPTRSNAENVDGHLRFFIFLLLFAITSPLILYDLSKQIVQIC